MKYLVAGSTGLIGKNLIKILSENYQVTALTRRDYKFPENVDQLILNYENSFFTEPRITIRSNNSTGKPRHINR